MAKKSSAQRPLPHCKALLLCDQILLDAVTGRVSIIGIRNSFVVAELPSPIERFSVFLQLMDGLGEYEVIIEIDDLRDDEIVARYPTSNIRFPERLSTINVRVPFPTVSIDHVGAYDLVVLIDGEEIGRQKFEVRTFQPEGEDIDDSP